MADVVPNPLRVKPVLAPGVKPVLTGVGPVPSPKVSWLKIRNRQSPWSCHSLFSSISTLLMPERNWFLVV